MIIDSSKAHQQEFPDMFAQYEEAKSWLENFGIKVNPTRFQKYKKSIEHSLRTSSGPYDREEDFNLLWAIVELHDLLDIHKNLKHARDTRVVESLRKVTTGPTLLDDEQSDGGNIHGRNFTFELYAASRLARAGFAVDFDTIADASFSMGDSKVYVECKRVVSENNMEELMASACKQIAKRCQNDPNSFGIAAISISKLVWKVLKDAPGVDADMEQLRLDMLGNLEKWGPVIIEKFKRFNQHTLGVILHYKIPFRRQSDGAVTFLNRFMLYPLCDAAEPRLLALKAVSDALHLSTNPGA
ncbi:hypothetical protein RSP822_17080 [Ralstonia solanacearum]|uniref:hypothetical protein n=1 Tax=Ralstonia solanacearum TaxID=305 RepID=UPI000E66645C|nr:hypothetical protein [Ralstonia solanacearum]RIJ85292.1 hypothetical protein RSP822_17080 [Ralstonia solanacearum]